MSEQPRLERQNGIVAGVCNGIAARFGWSPLIVRVILFIAVTGRLAGPASLRDFVDSYA
jgi:phage shock protein PspC (stress-responsive transcriptional regulator)